MHAVTPLDGKAGAFWLDLALSATRRAALDETEEVWTQCAAFDALLAISPQSVPSSIMRRLAVKPATLSAQLRDNRSEENTSELQSLMRISYAVFCLKKNKKT